MTKKPVHHPSLEELMGAGGSLEGMTDQERQRWIERTKPTKEEIDRHTLDIWNRAILSRPHIYRHKPSRPIGTPPHRQYAMGPEFNRISDEEGPKEGDDQDQGHFLKQYQMPGGTPRLGKDYTMPDPGWMIPPSEQFRDNYYSPNARQFNTDPGMPTRPRLPYYGQGGHRMEDMPEEIITMPEYFKRKISVDGIPARVITKTRTI